ncbi:MAG: RpiB/LacA/LacB family sugar-phosphate isomerase [Rickettsiales bacterium]|jgi:ribose 5-phosphate isomerase B|nr:RpiB/LacA/LacB family sugar-phosphate isomerase [Rickettsiales bacterium]
MKVYVANDHHGVGLKLYLRNMLCAAGYDVENLGVDNPDEKVDFPLVVAPVADKLLSDPSARGIVICGTGGGVLVAANRYRHIRATRCDRPDQAKQDRFHGDINVLALGADDIDLEAAFLVARSFLESPFDATERRLRRIKLIS